MKLHSPATSGLLAITAYDAGHIAVNGRRLTKSFLLMAEGRNVAATLIIECTG